MIAIAHGSRNCQFPFASDFHASKAFVPTFNYLSSSELKFKIDDIDAIGFGNGAMIKDLTGPIDIAFTLDEDCWNGSRKLQLKIVDIKI